MKPSLSLIIPVYNEQDNLQPLARKVLSAVRGLKLKSYEVIFIDDGSTDNTPLILKKLETSHRFFRRATLKRNFGKATAYTVGFRLVKYDYIITLDGDLQDNPQEIRKFIVKLNQGYDLVVGWKKKGKGSLAKTWLSRLFNLVSSRAFKLKLHDIDCPFKAYKRQVIQGLKIYSGLYRFIPVFAHNFGFKVTEIEIDNLPRASGQSKFGSRRILTGFLDFLTVLFITRFNFKPMHFFGTLALGCIFIGTAILGYLTVLHFQGQSIGTRPLFQLGILLEIVSLQLFSIGFIGEMLTRSLIEVDLDSIVKKTT